MYGIPERLPDGRVQNTYALVSPQGRIAGRHVKTHLPSCEDHIVPADELELIDSPLGRLGVLTCFELHIPELTRLYQILGADVLVFPTTEYEPFVLTEARVRAKDAHRPLLALAYAWAEKPEAQRPLGSAYIDQNGTVVAQSRNRRDLLVVDVPVRKGVNNDEFARRRPHVFRRIVESL